MRMGCFLLLALVTSTSIAATRPANRAELHVSTDARHPAGLAVVFKVTGTRAVTGTEWPLRPTARDVDACVFTDGGRRYLTLRGSGFAGFGGEVYVADALPPGKYVGEMWGIERSDSPDSVPRQARARFAFDIVNDAALRA